MTWTRVGLLSFVLGGAITGMAAEDEASRVLPRREAGDRRPSTLYARLQSLAEQSLRRRRSAYEELKTAEQIAAWQKSRREIFRGALGEFPVRGPLQPQVVDTIRGAGFRIEKVLFESRPRHHVSGNLYLPDSVPPHPAVIVPCGHSYNGKAAESYQRVSMLLAQNGIAALCYDPIGQGERYQTFGPDQRPLGRNYTGSPSSVKQLTGVSGDPRFNPVEEHTLIGVSSILVGTNTAQYRIWDGMRAIDYLASRPDIDARRIGCTGNSGGGTLTAYLMALDDRIVCAAPTCYLTSFERLLATAGPQDAEQNLFGQLAAGLDEADYVLMRAPRPTLLCAGTRDATFDIAGTWDILRDAKRTYARLGFPERVDLAEADEPHGFTQPLRVAAVRWLRRWLLHKDDAVSEPELTAYSAEQLQCTPRGQVMFLPEERSVFDFNRDQARLLAGRQAAAWKELSPTARIERVRRTAGIRAVGELPAARVQRVETVERAAYRLEKVVLERGDEAALPALMYVPSRPTGDAILYLDSDGKRAGFGPDGPYEKWVRQGSLVMAVDLEGLGELQIRHPRDWGRELFGPNTQEFFLGYLLGQSLVGIHAEDVLTAAQILSKYGEPMAPRRVLIEARGAATQLAALHARYVEPQLFAEAPVACPDLPKSWATLLDDPAAGERLPLVIHGVLEAYDLIDLGS